MFIVKLVFESKLISLLVKYSMSSEIKSSKIHVGILFNDIKPFVEYNELLIKKLNLHYITEVNLYSSNFKSIGDSKRCLRANIVFKKIHIFFHHTLIWRNKDKTLSYNFRAISLFGTDNQRRRIDNNLGFLPKLPRTWLQRYLVKLFSLNPMMYILRKFLLNVVFPFMAIKNSSCLANLDLVLIPYGARLSIEEDFLIWFAKQKQIKTVAIQENWDNLSSKKFIFSQADYFITWGEQSSSHLRQIHNYQGETHEFGCIRMQQFYTFRDTAIRNTEITYKYKSDDKLKNEIILFIGTGTSNDYELLIALKQFLKEDSYLSENRHFVFRPHPLSRNNLINDYLVFNHDKVKIEFPKENESNYYRIELMKKASLVIGFYSTVLLESLIMGKIVAIPSFIGTQNNYKSVNFLNDSAHFSGLKNLKNLYNLNSINEFKAILLNVPVEIEDPESSQILKKVCANKNTDLEISNFLRNLSANNTKQV
jgi:hypothetical protein